MKFFADRSVRTLCALVFAALVLFTVLTLWMVQRAGASAVLPVSGLAILFALVLLALLVWYFRRQVAPDRQSNRSHPRVSCRRCGGAYRF